MAKKFIDDNDKRIVNINLKVSQKEKDAIDEVAKKLGITVAATVRNATLSKVMKVLRTGSIEGFLEPIDE